MSTLDFRATSDPQNIVAELNLRIGSNVVYQNIDRTAALHVRESDVAPPAGAAGFRLDPGESYMMQVRADPIWVWTNDDQGCQLVLNEVM